MEIGRKCEYGQSMVYTIWRIHKRIGNFCKSEEVICNSKISDTNIDRHRDTTYI